MIYTVTLNPAVDYMMNMDTLHTGRVNRSKYESVYYGGKGINVSIVLKNMNVDSIVMGLIGGFTGIQLKSDIEQRGIKTDMIMLEKGITRINIKIDADVSTELNSAGPEAGENDIQKIYKSMGKLKDGDILVLSGSVPRGIKKTVYADIMGCLVHKDINVIVDTTGDLLLNTLKYKPFMVKPNINELGEIFGKRIIENKEVIYYGKIIQSMGARNVLISVLREIFIAD